jgi:PAS domain S-box-containing protein
MAAADATGQPRFLQAAPTLLRACLESIDEGIILADARDPDQTVVYVNQAFVRLTGYTPGEVIGRNCRFLQRGDSDQPEITLMRRALAEKQPVTVTLRNYRKNGSMFWNRVTIQPIRDTGGEIAFFMGAQRDVSHERGLEDNVQQAQKLEAIGLVAGGVAHDFNNVLGVILGASNLLMTEGRLSLEQGGHVEVILDAANRGAALARQLLALSRRSPREPKAFCPVGTLKGMEQMLRRLVPENIHVGIDVGPSVPHLFMDPGEFEQIVFNMVINARDAMRDGGNLMMSLRSGPRPAPIAEPDSPRSEGGVASLGAELRISDNGVGIPAELLSRIFEPFVTTKPAGQGTGLGLSVCQMIAKRYGGVITVHSRVGSGTTFSVWLPGCVAPDTETAARNRTEGPNFGGKHVLVVEDDVPLRSVFSRVLSRMGAQPTIMGRAEDAIDWLREPASPRPVLLMTDQMLPGMLGSRLIEHVKREWPEIRALLVSGHVCDAATEARISAGEVSFLAKPFSVHELQERLHALFRPATEGTVHTV